MVVGGYIGWHHTWDHISWNRGWTEGCLYSSYSSTTLAALWFHAHTHGVIADTTAVHTLSTLTAWHLDAPGSMLTLTTLLPHTDGWWTNGSVFCYFVILFEDRWFRVALLGRQRKILPSCPKEESQQKKVKARCTLCTLHRLSDCIWTEPETTASVWCESIIQPPPFCSSPFVCLSDRQNCTRAELLREAL